MTTPKMQSNKIPGGDLITVDGEPVGVQIDTWPSTPQEKEALKVAVEAHLRYPVTFGIVWSENNEGASTSCQRAGMKTLEDKLSHAFDLQLPGISKVRGVEGLNPELPDRQAVPANRNLPVPGPPGLEKSIREGVEDHVAGEAPSTPED